MLACGVSGYGVAEARGKRSNGKMLSTHKRRVKGYKTVQYQGGRSEE